MSERISEGQINVLEGCIVRSEDATEFAKKAVIWLLRQSEGLTRRVALCIPGEQKAILANEMRKSVHDMVSSGGLTHIDAVLAYDIGTNFKIWSGMGLYRGSAFVDSETAATIWFSDENPPIGVSALFPSIEEIQAVELPAA